jgi:hypothetical protein
MAMMKTAVNLEEGIGKTVGRRQPPQDPLALTDAQRSANAVAWKRALGTLRIKKGVYRFRTHEEADEWLWQKLTRRPD